MNPVTTTALCALSAAAWNALLLALGMTFAHNWHRVADYLALYGKVMTVAVVVALIISLWWYLRRKI